MSKRQKGRKHRSVNRTPRPVRRQQREAPRFEAAVAASARGDSPGGHEPTPPTPLGRHVTRTYIRLAEAGAHTVQELCDAVGYTPRTIARHLEDLTRQGLAARSSDGRWTVTEARRRDAAVR
ncbi:winged helix-turn-helix domain-containing protein [Streptomyces sp. NPDC059874]|uniref:winged helix-turn-helix domain-containing protein n=1 Tax=Streptomyces sp. NPDC059874 TaxID=3346983 RepID=UPI00364CEA73